MLELFHTKNGMRTTNVPVLPTNTRNISYIIRDSFLLFFNAGFFVPCHIPDIWVYRAHGKKRKGIWEACSHLESAYKHCGL